LCGDVNWYWVTLLSPVRASVTALWHWIQAVSPTVATLLIDPPDLLDEPQPYSSAAIGSRQNSVMANLRICILFSSLLLC
jgi:hypothetical protein